MLNEEEAAEALQLMSRLALSVQKDEYDLAMRKDRLYFDRIHDYLEYWLRKKEVNLNSAALSKGECRDSLHSLVAQYLRYNQ